MAMKFSVSARWLSAIMLSAFFGGPSIAQTASIQASERGRISDSAAVQPAQLFAIRAYSNSPTLDSLTRLEADPTRPVLLGAGFNGLTGTWPDLHCFDQKKILSGMNSPLTGGGRLKLDVHYIDNFESIKNTQNVSIFAAARYGAYSGSFDYSSYIEQSVRETSVYAVLTLSAFVGVRSVDLSPDDLLPRGPRSPFRDSAYPSSRTDSTFGSKCGTHYVSSIGYGAYLKILVSATNLTRQEHRAMTAALKGGFSREGASANVGAAVSSFFESIQSTNKFQFHLIQDGSREMCGGLDAADSYISKINSPDIKGPEKLSMINRCGNAMLSSIASGLKDARSSYDACVKAQLPGVVCRLADFEQVTVPIFYNLKAFHSLGATRLDFGYEFVQGVLVARLLALEASHEVSRVLEFRERYEPRISSADVNELKADWTRYTQLAETLSAIAERCGRVAGARPLPPECAQSARVDIPSATSIRRRWAAGRSDWIDLNFRANEHGTIRPVETSLGGLAPGHRATVSLRGAIWHHDLSASGGKTVPDLWDWCQSGENLYTCWVIVTWPNSRVQRFDWVDGQIDGQRARFAPVISGPAMDVTLVVNYNHGHSNLQALPENIPRCAQNSSDDRDAPRRVYFIKPGAALNVLPADAPADQHHQPKPSTVDVFDSSKCF
jgi:hypothetical protein